MKVLRVFILGLLYGWFLKFVIDRIYHENELAEIQNENAGLKEYIHALEIKLQTHSTESKAQTPATTKDDLKAIKGIGPALEKKLHAAGIQTFQDLARLSVEELGAILGNTRRTAKEADLIAQARELAKQ